MTLRGLTVRLLVAFILLAPCARVQAASTDEVWVELKETTCDGTPVPLWLGSSGAGLQHHDVDLDTNVGASEDSDADSVFSTINAVLSNAAVNADGIIHLLGHGRDREVSTQAIVDSVTIRASGDFILSDDCSSSTSTALAISIASGETVTLENLTIREYTKGIDASGSTGGTLILRHCTIVDCTTGINADSPIAVILEDSKIIGGTTGIDASAGSAFITLTDSTIERATTGVLGSDSEST